MAAGVDAGRLAGAVALAIGLAMGLAACGQQAEQAVLSHVGRDWRPCRSADLALKRLGEDTRTNTVTYRFENRSTSICVLRDHARVVLTGLDGKALPIQVENYGPSPDVQPREPKVVLRPGRRADFKVVFPPRAARTGCRRYVKLTASAPGSDWGLDSAEAANLCGSKLLVSTFWADTRD